MWCSTCHSGYCSRGSCGCACKACSTDTFPSILGQPATLPSDGGGWAAATGAARGDVLIQRLPAAASATGRAPAEYAVGAPTTADACERGMKGRAVALSELWSDSDVIVSGAAFVCQRPPPLAAEGEGRKVGPKTRSTPAPRSWFCLWSAFSSGPPARAPFLAYASGSLQETRSFRGRVGYPCDTSDSIGRGSSSAFWLLAIPLPGVRVPALTSCDGSEPRSRGEPGRGAGEPGSQGRRATRPRDR